ncbi:MAG: hypothetical protein J7M19_00605, partial [Planctomycetes bacterium]|nr:hypothetical protein [Planctomycetota bacterium]
MADYKVAVTVENPGKEKALGAGVSAGVPFARGALKETSGLTLTDSSGKAAPLQAECLAKWPDGSCRWVLLDFAADVAAGSSADFVLKTSGENPAPGTPVTAADDTSTVTLSNGLVEFAVKTGTAGGTLKSADGKRSVDIASIVEIGGDDGRITSEVVVDSLDVYAEGPLRAAVSLYGRRIYSDGLEGPFSQRVEMFAGSPYIRVEDTFIYAHFPGT